MANVNVNKTMFEQITKQHEKKTCPLIKLVAIDFLQMTLEAEMFSCFLDKGMLGALMSSAN